MQQEHVFFCDTLITLLSELGFISSWGPFLLTCINRTCRTCLFRRSVKLKKHLSTNLSLWVGTEKPCIYFIQEKNAHP